MIQNLHTHTSFSDGSDKPQRYIGAAFEKGLSSVGFSDHSPLPFENSFALRDDQLQNYCDTIRSLRDPVTFLADPRYLPGDPDTGNISYKNSFRIFLGLEVDFIPGTGHSFAWLKSHYPVDYMIGSVHLVCNGSPDDLWFIDGPDPATYDEGLNRLFGGDIRKGVAAYYRQINSMISGGNPEIIGHLDKIKMHNRGRLFSEDEAWYQSLVDETLDLIKASGSMVEVNTRGLYKKRSDSHFPGPVILQKIHDLNIPVIITSDAHKPAEIAMLFRETGNLLYELGIRELMNLTPVGWETVPLRI